MAVLKDLIVHGPSKFIGKTYIDTLEADSVKANEGLFTKLAAKSASANELTVSGLLDVHGELHTKSWSNSNIATVDGNLHIVPTVTAATAKGKITYKSSAYSMDLTGAFDTNTLTIGTDTNTVNWTPGSSLIVSGEVQIGNEWLPLGTLTCDLGGSAPLPKNAESKTIPLVSIKDSNKNVPEVLESIRATLNFSETSSSLDFRNIKIAFYSRKNTKMYPIGILLTAQGTGASKTFIDMYDGNHEASGTYGGLAEPVVRIGNLSGNSNITNNQPLSPVGGQTPTGWGIYTSNGYFSGTIAAEKGKIANFTINGTKLYSNDHSAYNTSVTGIYIGDDYISFGSGGVTYFNTSGTGKIGPWTLSTSYIRNGAIANATNTSVKGVYLGTDGLNISNGTAATTAYITKTAVNIGNKLTWDGITLSVSGTINASAGKIGDCSISGGKLKIAAANVESGTFEVARIPKLEISQINSLSSEISTAKNTADSFIYYTSTTGLKLAQTNPKNATTDYINIKSQTLSIIRDSTHKAVINSEGMKIYSGDATNEVASFGATATIGKTTEEHITLTDAGLNVFKHLTVTTPLAVEHYLKSVAFFGETARIGMADQPHVNINSDSISMSDGTRTVYEVKQASSPIVITKIYDHKLDDGRLYEDTVALGRAVSSWTKITMTCTVKHGSKTTTYAPTFTSVPIDVETANYSFTLDSASDSSEYTFGVASGTGFAEGDVFTLKSIKFEFSTTQQVVESTLGAFADTSYSGPFRVGKGVSTDSKANAMLIDWAGNAMFGGDISVNCGANSSGGLSLTKDKSITGAYSYESSTATVIIDVHQVGMLVMLEILVTNTNSIAGGSNISQVSLANAQIPTPVASTITGSSYYGNHAIGFAINHNEDTGNWQLVTRNASNSAVAVTSFILGTLTYAWDGGYTNDK